MKIKIIGLLLLIATIIQIHAQTSQKKYTSTSLPVAPQTMDYKIPIPSYIPPEATNLINAIRYPVGYNTGKVDITIPLYEVEVAGVKVPISISFNHKGLKPGSITKFIGQGWTLNADYTIVTSINGKPDYNGTTNLLRSVNDPAMQSEFSRIDHKYQLAYASNYYDFYPDEYYYTLSGKSGMFMYAYKDGTYKPIMAPFEPLKVERLSKNSFTITDDNGCKYSFGTTGSDMNCVEYTSSYNTGWKVNQIDIPGNRQIQFNYGGYTYSNIMPSHFAIVEDIVGNGNDDRVLRANDRYNSSIPSKYLPRITGTYAGAYPNGFQEYITGMEGDLQTPIQRQYISKIENSSFGTDVYVKQISSIVFDYGTVSFVRSTGGLIQNIIVKDKSNNTVRQVVFNHSMIDGCPVLNSVVIYGKDTVTPVDKYIFDYYAFPTLMTTLNFKRNTNFWGYLMSGWADDNLNITAVPTWRWANQSLYSLNQNLFVIGNSDREVNAVNSGMLKSITNIIGGTTEFTYESDAYKKTCYNNPFDITSGSYTQNKQSGGLRIAEIADRDEAGNVIRKRTFKYGENESGLGMTRFSIRPDNYMTQRYTSDIEDKYSSKRIRERRFQSDLFGDNTFSGIPVAYKTVSEYVYSMENGTLINSGKTTYDYYYPSDFVYIYKIAETNVVCDPKNYWSFGQLASKKDYRANSNNQYTLVQSTTNNYVSYYESIQVKQVYETATYTNLSGYPYYSDSDLHEFDSYNWEISLGGNRLASEEVLDFGFSNTGVKKSYTYNNANHNYPNIVTTSHSYDNSVIKKEYLIYALDNLTTNDAENNAAKTKMVSMNMVNTLLESRVEQGSHTDQTLYMYKVFSDNVPRLSRVDVKNGTSATKTRVRYKSYDSYGNPMEVVVDEEKSYVYLWSYFGRFMVAEIRNAPFAAVSALLTTGYGNTPPSNFENTLRSNLSGALITFYEFDPFVGIKSITNQAGVKTNYNYNNAGQLIGVEDGNNSKTLESYQYLRKNQ